MLAKPFAIFGVAALTLAGCQTTTTAEQRTVIGATGGAAAGLAAASALGADDEWLVIGALAGASAGTLIAQNNQRNICAYSRGDGTYYEAPCP